jgi:chitosanase
LPSIFGGSSVRTPGLGGRPASSGEGRAEGRRPSQVRLIPALVALLAGLTSPSCRRGGDGDAGQAPPVSVGSPTAEPESHTSDRRAGSLTPEQRLRADRLINNFEHGTIEFRYGSAEALDDGRGITFGRAGFTTKSGDGLDVIRRYTAAKPENPLARFLPRLESLAREESGSIEGLDGFVEAVRQEAGDLLFRRSQDDLQDELYYRPSARFSDSLGLKTALARAAIYDTLLMHGAGDDPDGLPALLERTRKEAGGTPATGVDEAAWLSAFLRIRREDLANARDPETRQVWARSAGRVDTLRTLADQGNWELHGPIVLRGEYAAMIP